MCLQLFHKLERPKARVPMHVRYSTGLHSHISLSCRIIADTAQMPVSSSYTQFNAMYSQKDSFLLLTDMTYSLIRSLSLTLRTVRKMHLPT